MHYTKCFEQEKKVVFFFLNMPSHLSLHVKMCCSILEIWFLVNREATGDDIGIRELVASLLTPLQRMFLGSLSTQSVIHFCREENFNYIFPLFLTNDVVVKPSQFWKSIAHIWMKVHKVGWTNILCSFPSFIIIFVNLRLSLVSN